MSDDSTPFERLHVETRELPTGGMTPAMIYRALRRSGESVLIENGGAGGHAFIGLDPLETFVFNDDAAMLDRIRVRLQRYRLTLTESPPAYGFICTFSYDAALALHGIPGRKSIDRLFGEAYVFVPGTWISIDRITERLTLSAIYRMPAEKRATTERLNDCIRRLTAAKNPAAKSESAPAHVGPQRRAKASLSRNSFLARVSKAQRGIRQGDVYQVVLGIRFTCRYDEDALALYERLSARNPSPCAFLIQHDGRSLVGASPEFLVRLEGERATLRPLAGTRPRGDSVQHDEAMAEELLADVKERAEHVMLVDLARNDLSRVCRVGSVRVEQALAIERYSHVMHMASSVSGRIADGRDAFDLFLATFPAGTVTGAPKRRAMQLIARLEPTARDAYAGSVAHFRLDGSMDAALTLRSIAVADGQAVWQAAAGIVHRSKPELEYAEVLAKTRIARTVLGVAEPSIA